MAFSRGLRGSRGIGLRIAGRGCPARSRSSCFSIAPGGIYFVPEFAGAGIPIRFFDLTAGVSRLVETVDGLSAQGISASPDNRTLVSSCRESNDRDLMLIEFPK